MLPDDGGGGLFLAPIEIPPGDPGALCAAAGTYTAAHGEIERNRAALARTVGGATDAQWIGVGAQSFGTVTSELAAAFSLTAAALAKGATALRAYSAALARAKETASKANAEVELTNRTAAALLAAESAARTSQQTAQQASQDADTAQAHATAHPHSVSAASAAQSAQQTARDAQDTANSDASKVSALTAKYNSERADALRLCALAKQQATTAARDAAAAFDSATVGLLDNKPSPARGGAHGDAGSPWEGLGEVVENTHTALGFLLADGVLWYLGKGAEKAEKFMDDLPKTELEWMDEMFPWGKDASSEEWASAVHSWFMRSDAAEAFGEQWVNATKVLGMVSTIGRTVGGPVTVAGDVLTIVDPPQAGILGDVDRVAAGVNGGLVGYDTVGAIGALAGIDAMSWSLPPVGVAVTVGTGLYIAGAYAYKHWGFFRNDIANPIGHGAVSLVKGAAHGISDLGHLVGL